MISVIVPVYNVKDYLDQCIQSIVSQTYSQFECILVDDGSNDGSGEICDSWQQKDSRIIVVHQENQGVSAARNKGLQNAKGDYVTFIDSDDWVDDDYLQSLIAPLLQDSPDLVVIGLIQEYPNCNRIVYKPSDSYSFILNKESVESFIGLNQKFLLYGPVVKLYKRDIIEKYYIRFDVSCSYGEDLLFNYCYLENINKIACISQAVYHYRMIGEGTLSTKLRVNQFEVDYQQWKVLREFYKKRGLWGEQLSKDLLYKRLWGIVYDGIFLFSRLPNKKIEYLKLILDIPEIEELKKHSDLYVCSLWIKKGILSRCYWIFYLYFLLRK